LHFPARGRDGNWINIESTTRFNNCQNTNAAKGCYVSFDASSTGSAGITHTAADADSVGTDVTVATLAYGASGTFVFTAAGTRKRDLHREVQEDRQHGDVQHEHDRCADLRLALRSNTC
jgi:hypothetical protein